MASSPSRTALAARDCVDIVPLEDKEKWIAEHRREGLPSQSWYNAWAVSALGIEPKLAVVQSDGSRMLLPFFERFWNGYIDVATIQGLSGASIYPNSVAPFSLWCEFAKSRYIAGFIQLAAGEIDEAARRFGVVSCKDVYVLDISRSDLFGLRISRNIRRKIKRAQSSSGLVLVDDPERVAEALVRLHPLTADRVRAEQHHRYPPETLKRWALDPGAVVLGAQLDGTIEAACVFSVAATHAEYHIAGTSEAGRDLTSWLIWRATQRLHDRGVQIVNLGAGVQPNDGLCRFKEQLGGTRLAQCAIQQIYDTATYERLCASQPALSKDWFPAYRSRQPSDATNSA